MCVERDLCAPLRKKLRAQSFVTRALTKTNKVMSDQETSGEPKVASSETPSAPPSPVATTAAEPAAFPTFGTSRGSGLARGKRATNAAPAEATKNTAGDYRPTAIHVVTTEREYKNPFAAETPSVPEAAPVVASAPSAAPAAPAPAPTIALAAPEVVPVAPVATAPTIASTPETKAELKILPPEQRQQPAQSWESSSFAENKAPAAGNRPTFRVERRDQRENVPGREPLANPESRERETGRDNRSFRDQRENRAPRENRDSRDPREAREPREARDPRDQRQPRDPRDPRAPRENRSEGREPRDARPLAARPLPTPPAPKKTGFFGWLKNLFAGTPKAEKAPQTETPAPNRNDERGDDGRRHHHRGGRGRGGYRDQRGPRDPRDSREGGPSPTGSAEGENGERRFEGGQRRRRHRGGRGRGGFDNRGGDRPDQGGSNGS